MEGNASPNHRRSYDRLPRLSKIHNFIQHNDMKINVPKSKFATNKIDPPQVMKYDSILFHQP